MPSNSKSCIGFQLVFLHLTLTSSKSQDQSRAHFDSEYLGNGQRWGKIYNCHQIANHFWAFD